MVREHLDVVLRRPIAHKGGTVHWGIVPAQKPLSCGCRHHPFLLQSLHRDTHYNVGIDSDDQKHTVGEYHPQLIKEGITIFFSMESWTLVWMDKVIIS
jgi:hypothetical protein